MLYALGKATARWTRSRGADQQGQLVPAFNAFQVCGSSGLPRCMTPPAHSCLMKTCAVLRRASRQVDYLAASPQGNVVAAAQRVNEAAAWMFSRQPPAAAHAALSLPPPRTHMPRATHTTAATATRVVWLSCARRLPLLRLWLRPVRARRPQPPPLRRRPLLPRLWRLRPRRLRMLRVMALLTYIATAIACCLLPIAYCYCLLTLPIDIAE